MAALDDIRVLDLTRLLPGPLATLVLADLGARVDKLEDPQLGDYTRHTPPVVAGQGAAYHALNRGKRSAVLDLKRPEGVAVFKRLLPHYDVVFEQFRPGVLSRLGLSHATLLDENPRLVVCALTGYGQDGPLSGRAGHDINYLARSGLLGLQGPKSDKPQIPAFQLADVSGGMWSVIAILGALLERQHTGKGKIIDIAMLDSVLPFATISLSRLLGGELPARGDELLTGGIAPYDSYLTQDGEAVTLGALEPKFLTRFCAANGIDLDLSALLPGPHQAELKRKFADVIASRTRSEWEEFNRQHDCCLEPVLRPDELMADEQLRARGAFFSGNAGDSSVQYFRTPVTPRELSPSTAPEQGEQTDQVLSDAGFSPPEIAELRSSGVIR